LFAPSNQFHACSFISKHALVIHWLALSGPGIQRGIT
jgi:hypothetical protein